MKGAPLLLYLLLTNLITYRTTGVGLQRHDPHLQRLRQRGVLGSAFRRATQAACDGTAFYKKLYQRLDILIANTVVVVGVVEGSQNSYGTSCMYFVAKQKKRKTQSLVQITLLCFKKIRNNEQTETKC